MTKEEWQNLPLRIALGVLFDLLPSIGGIDKPRAALPPKYDAKFTKGRGVYVFMSEMTLNDLQYWHGKRVESSKSGSQYAEKDGKAAETMARWIAWRQCYPTDQWFGERGDKKVTAAVPSREPQLHNWSDSQRSGGQRREQSAPADDGYGDPVPPKADDDYGDGADDIPF